MKSKYWYEMVKRPFSIGCEPEGVVEVNHDKGSWGIVCYERELTNDELIEYEMREWKEG